MFNESLFTFLRQFLNSVQKQGKEDDKEKAKEDNGINKARFKEIIKSVLLIFWRMVSNNIVSTLLNFRKCRTQRTTLTSFLNLTSAN